MRISISHTISYAYAEPARHITQILRLTPRDHDGQHVMAWRIEPTIDGRLQAGQDAYGNIIHRFSADGPITEMAIQVNGLIETVDLAGVVRGAVERVPPDVFRRDTMMTMPGSELRSFVGAATSGADTPLGKMHALMEALHETMTCVPADQRTGIGAAAAFEARAGIAQDLAHVFMAGARHLSLPARYVSGYVAHAAALPQAAGAHAWAEIYLENYGWIGFDCANGLCPIDTHVRVAIGLDYGDAAPVRGARKGGQGENLAVRVTATEAGARASNQ